MDHKEVETSRVRDLLGRALADVRAPVGRGSEALFAQPPCCGRRAGRQSASRR